MQFLLDVWFVMCGCSLFYKRHWGSAGGSCMEFILVFGEVKSH